MERVGRRARGVRAEIEQRKSHHLFAKRAAEWLTVREFSSTRECIEELRETGHVIWATDLSQEAVCLTKEGLRRDFPRKLAIVFGTEAVGCTNEIRLGLFICRCVDLRIA